MFTFFIGARAVSKPETSHNWAVSFHKNNQLFSSRELGIDLYR
jgi:hypothetical protein